MNYGAINQKFTEKVMEWLSKGYYINTATMRGSQGERGKVDVTNGVEIVRIALVTFDEHSVDIAKREYEDYTGLEIVVGRDTSGQMPNVDSGFDTIWNHELEVMSRDRFYFIGGNRTYNDWYGSKEEARKAQMIRFARYKDSENSDGIGNKVFGIKAAEIVLQKVRAERGCKGAKADSVTVQKHVYNDTVRYYVNYNGKTIRLA